MDNMQKTNQNGADQLNDLLRGELSAVETYRIALEKLESQSGSRPELQTCMASHAQRVEKLRSAITQLGAKPADGSGAWGAFAKLVEGTASVLGDKMAINALEQGEDKGLSDYRSIVPKLDSKASQLVSPLLSQQEDTHRRMSMLKKQLQS